MCFDEKPNTKSYLPSAMILKSCQRQFLPLPNHESYLDSDHFLNPKIMVNPWPIATIFYPDMVITKSLSIVASDNNLATVWTKVVDDVVSSSYVSLDVTKIMRVTVMKIRRLTQGSYVETDRPWVRVIRHPLNMHAQAVALYFPKYGRTFRILIGST